MQDLILAVLLGIVAPPSTITGRISAGGGAVVSAEVSLVELGRHTTTDTNGVYRIPSVPAGTFTLAVRRLGYVPIARRITIERDTTLDFVMEPAALELPGLQVTATAAPTEAFSSPQPTSTLEGTLLRTQQAPTLAEVVSNLPGVRNVSTGEGIGKPMIRGLSSNRVLVAADGQRLETQQWGDEHGSNIDPADAERIEVIRGPASVLYGSDALGGVINVVTAHLPEAIGRSAFMRARGHAAYSTGSRQPGGTATLEAAAGAVGIRGSLTGRTSDDVRTPAGALFNSGSEALDGTVALGLHGGFGELRADLSHRAERLEIHEDPADDPAATPFQRVRENRGKLALTTLLGASRLEITAGYERNRRREFEESGAEQAGDLALGLLSKTYSSEVHFHHAPSGPWRGTLGLSGLLTSFEKSGEETLIPNSNMRNAGVFAFEQGEFGRTTVSAGARLDYRVLHADEDLDLGVRDQTRRWTSFSGNLGLLYRVSEPLALVLNAGRGFRAPSTFELFSFGVHEGTGRFEVGDSTLRNEISFNLDAAIRWQSGNVRGEIGGFVNRISDFIYPQPTGTDDAGTGFPIFNNVQGNALFAGLEAAGTVQAGRALRFDANADFVRGQNETTGEPLPFVPPARVSLTTRLQGHPQKGILAPYASVSVAANATQTRVAPNDVAPAGYVLASSGAGFILPAGRSSIAVDLSVQNLFDKAYVAFLSRYKTYGVPAYNMGRSFTIQVRIE